MLKREKMFASTSKGIHGLRSTDDDRGEGRARRLEVEGVRRRLRG